MTTKNNPEREQFIEGILSQMSTEQKVGQCFTYLYSGWLVTPSVVDAITKLHAGNLRVQPAFQSGKRHKYYSFDTGGAAYDYPPGYKPIPETLLLPGELGAIQPNEYAALLNKLQAIATSRPGGIPLNMAIDQEGDISRNYPFGGIKMFPMGMGMAASNDPRFVHDAHKALAKQLSAMGINCIHSPVVDVNINVNNPEIGIRSFGDDPKRVAEFGLAAMKGLQAGGMITTAKHFPGRGDSMSDAHFDTPSLDVDRKRLDSVELVPYKALIKGGLDCIMIAHNIYTALDPGVIATVSKKIITGLLRNELGFDGVVTTDAIGMGALMKAYGLPEACARALEAGADLVLNKTETVYRDQGFCETLKFVQQGRIPMEELDNKVRRILRVKYNRGLFKKAGQVDAAKADKPIRDKKTIEIATQAARRAAVMLKNEDGLLPLTPAKKLLVVEQKLEHIYMGLDTKLHRLNFTEAMLGHSMNIVAADTEFKATEADEKLILELAKDVDAVVMTCFYYRNEASNVELANKLLAQGSKVIAILNSPYPMALPKGIKTALCTFSNTPSSMKVAADVLFGKDTPQGTWPLKDYKVQ